MSIDKLTFTRLDQIALGGVIAFYEVKNINVFSAVKTIRILSVFILLLVGYTLFAQEEFFFYKEFFKYNILELILYVSFGLQQINPPKKFGGTAS